MPDKTGVVVLSGVRTAIGDFGGALKSVAPTDLGALVVRESIQRASLAGSDIGHVVFGNVIHTEPRDMYLARVAAVNGGVPIETPALTLNRLCGSGLQAIVSAAQMIQLGDVQTAVAGGAESMSKAPYWNSGMRWGQRLGDGKIIDAMVAALHDPFQACHMGVTAENVAKKWNISRTDQDQLALESHRRAAKALADGVFKEQIVPVEIKSKKQTVSFTIDEHVRSDVTLKDFEKLATVFQEGGTVTAGNASGINDGAAAVVLASESFAKERGLKPMARLVGYAHAGVEPEYMGIGPVPATRKVLERTGLKITDLDVIEANEAFAAQALAVTRSLELPPEKTNPNGSGISLGHPIGATGCIISVKAIHELHRIGGRFALVTMCIGGGQGIAAIFERL